MKMRAYILLLFSVINISIVASQNNNRDRGKPELIFSGRSVSDTIYKTKRYINDSMSVDSLVWLSFKNKNDTLYEALYKKNEMRQISIFFFKNKSKREEVIYENGKQCQYSAWYSNGKQREVIETIGNSFPCTTWYETGTIESVTKYKGDKGIEKSWFENGNPKTQTEIIGQGIIDGRDEEWCENGQKIKDEYINRGKCVATDYWCNGRKKAERTYINSSFFLVGKLSVWYENGLKREERLYKDGNTPEEANYKIGTWSYWDEQGNLIRQETYKDNVLIDAKDFLPTNRKTEIEK